MHTAAVMAQSHRKQVLSLYRKIFNIAKNWQAMNPAETPKERDYIRDEARQLFRQNRQVENEIEIKEHIQEAEARIEIAIHYSIPYPRPVNIPTNVLPPSAKRLKAREKALKMAKPLYVKSYKFYDKDVDS